MELYQLKSFLPRLAEYTKTRDVLWGRLSNQHAAESTCRRRFPKSPSKPSLIRDFGSNST